MNAHVYTDIPEGDCIPFLRQQRGEGIVIQQDNAPCHCSRYTRSFLADKNVQTLDWPSNSPDLNPIENLWKQMKSELKQVRVSTREELKAQLARIWSAMDQAKIINLIE